MVTIDCIFFPFIAYSCGLFKISDRFQDGRQVLGVLCVTFAIVQEPHENGFTTVATPLLYAGARGSAHVEIQADFFCLMSFRVIPFSVMPLKEHSRGILSHFYQPQN